MEAIGGMEARPLGAGVPFLDGVAIRGRNPVFRETPACGHARASHDTAARVHVRLQTFAKTRGVRARLMHYTVSAF